MKLLLDSHTLIWAMDDPSRLGPQASKVLANPANTLFLSTGTIWEIAIKIGIKKLSLSLPFRTWMSQAIGELGLVVLHITVESAEAQIELHGHHRDPFDRLLVVQAKTENLRLVSADTIFDQNGVQRLW